MMGFLFDKFQGEAGIPEHYLRLCLNVDAYWEEEQVSNIKNDAESDVHAQCSAHVSDHGGQWRRNILHWRRKRTNLRLENSEYRLNA